MMLYLAGSSRPDIVYAVHQCARFFHNPKRSHGVGLKYIARYLKGTRNKGLIMVPNLDDMKLDLFTDADFEGLYSMEDSEDPVSVKSCTGLLLNYGDVPICWSSKLQTKIVLSTLKAEYITLFQGVRELVAVRRLVLELCSKMNFNIKGASILSCAWE